MARKITPEPEAPASARTTYLRSAATPPHSRPLSAKSAGKPLLFLALTLCALLSASSILVTPTASAPLHFSPDAAAPLSLDPPFPSPQNVKIVRTPDNGECLFFNLSWDPVPGASSYRVYTAVAVPDSSLLIPIIEPIILDNVSYWVYRYTRHPIFGDIMWQRNWDTNAPMNAFCFGGAGSGTTAKFSPFVLETTGILSGCTYTLPNAGERDRFFVVTAVR